jgi:hypothetical protein
MNSIFFYHEDVQQEAILTTIHEKNAVKYMITFADRRISNLYGSFEYVLKDDRLLIMTLITAFNERLVGYFHDQIVLFYLK